MKIIINFLIFCFLLPLVSSSQETMFFIEADNVNVRALPTTKSQSLGKIPKKRIVSWADSVEVSNELVNWNGKPIKGKWYKISTYIQKNTPDGYMDYQHIEGWIFEKAFDYNKRIRNYYFKDIDFSKTIDNEQLKIEVSNEFEFEQSKPNTIKVLNTKKFQKDSILSLPLSNGEKHYVYENIKTDSDDWLRIAFCGEAKTLDTYILHLGYYESSSFEFIKKSDGLPIAVEDFAALSFSGNSKYADIDVSPDRRFVVLGREDSYSPSSICFIDLKNNTSLLIECDQPKMFRWLDAKIGVAYLEEHDYKKNTLRKTYLKFTFK